MNRKFSTLAGCLGAVLLLSAASSKAADEGSEGGTAKAEDMPTICKDQAAKLNLSGSDAESFVAKCTATVSEGARVGEGGGAGRLEGTQ